MTSESADLITIPLKARSQEDQWLIDAQFDLENSVPDMTPYVEYAVAASQRVTEEIACELDIPFGPTTAEKLDLFRAQKRGAPILVWIHGGWWRALNRKIFNFTVRGPAQLGFAVVSADYALCPKVSIPEITRTARAAVVWAYHNAERINGDRNRIYVAGHSAGGHLVGMLGITDWERDYDLPGRLIRGGIPISGLFDLRPFQYSWLQPLIQLTGESALDQSPMFQVPAAGPPMLVTLGAEESLEFHRQSEKFVHAWQSRGLHSRYLDLEDENHFTVIYQLQDGRSRLCREISDFVEFCECH